MNNVKKPNRTILVNMREYMKVRMVMRLIPLRSDSDPPLILCSGSNFFDTTNLGSILV